MVGWGGGGTVHIHSSVDFLVWHGPCVLKWQDSITKITIHVCWLATLLCGNYYGASQTILEKIISKRMCLQRGTSNLYQSVEVVKGVSLY